MIPGTIGNIIVLAFVGLLVFFAARNIIAGMKSGSCCGNCSACGGSCSCQAKTPPGKAGSSEETESRL